MSPAELASAGLMSFNWMAAEYEIWKHSNKIISVIYNDHPQFRNTTQFINTDGWDNLVVIMDARVMFRVPRNELSCKQLHVEMHFLPQIAAVSPLPMPVYTYCSKEPGLYAGYELMPGEPFVGELFAV